MFSLSFIFHGIPSLAPYKMAKAIRNVIKRFPGLHVRLQAWICPPTSLHIYARERKYGRTSLCIWTDDAIKSNRKMTCRSGNIWAFIPIFANQWQPDYHLQLAILSTQIGHWTLGRLLAYVLQIACLCLADCFPRRRRRSGLRRDGTESKMLTEVSKMPKEPHPGAVMFLMRSNDRFGFNLYRHHQTGYG